MFYDILSYSALFQHVGFGKAAHMSKTRFRFRFLMFFHRNRGSGSGSTVEHCSQPSRSQNNSRKCKPPSLAKNVPIKPLYSQQGSQLTLALMVTTYPGISGHNLQVTLAFEVTSYPGISGHKLPWHMRSQLTLAFEVTSYPGI